MRHTLVWWDAPLLRALLCLIAGILCFDRFALSSVEGSIGMGVCFACVLLGWFLRKRSVWWRGLGISAFFVAIGGASVYRAQTVRSWTLPESEMCHDVQFVSPAVVKGKVIRVEALLLRSYFKDTLQQRKSIDVHRRVALTFRRDSTTERIQLGTGGRIFATFSPTIPDRDIDGFDYDTYLYRKGIVATAFVQSRHYRALPMGEESLRIRALKIRECLVEMIGRWQISETAKGVIAALTVGDKSALDAEVRQAYTAAGVSHVLALSGLHVGILAAVLWVVLYPLRRVRWGRTVAAVVLLGVLWAFAFVTGLSASVLRAVGMCTLFQVYALCTEERIAPLHVVATMAFFMLLWEPMYLFDVGFQLSFTAVTGLLLGMPLLAAYRPKHALLRYPWQVVTASVVAQTAVLPLVLYHFGTFPVYFLSGNLIMLPMVFLLMMLFLLTCFVQPLPGVALYAERLLGYLTDAANNAMLYISRLTGAQWQSLYIDRWQALLLGIVLFLWGACVYRFTARRIIRALAMSCVFMSVLLWDASQAKDSVLELHGGRISLIENNRRTSLSQTNGIYSVRGVYVAVLRTGDWRYKESNAPLPLHTLYLCKGFRGRLEYLVRLFSIRSVVLDDALPSFQREKLVAECERQGLSYRCLERGTAHRIRLNTH